MVEQLFEKDFWSNAFAEGGSIAALFEDGTGKKEPYDLEASRKMWDEHAIGFARKIRRSRYIAQLLEYLQLAPDTTVLDAGSGSGTLAIPLAQGGCEVHALDFSFGMLQELRYAAEAAGVAIPTYQRAWQEPWDDIPVCDVAITSRSFITDDLADGIAKLESHARTRCVATHIFKNPPWVDKGLLEALGREIKPEPPYRLLAFINYLFALGRMPRISYITYQSEWDGRTRESLVEDLRREVRPEGAAEEAAFEAFTERSISYNDELGCWSCTAGKMTSWAIVDWDVPQNDLT